MPAKAKHQIKLTERRIDDHIRSGAGPDVVLWDTACPGLGLRKASWIVRVHPRGGRKIVRAIGKARGPGALSLAEAREKATERITEIRGGDDSKASVMTVRALLTYWQENHRTPIKRRKPADDCDAVRRCKLLTDRWGGRRIDQITHKDVQALVNEITERGTPFEANPQYDPGDLAVRRDVEVSPRIMSEPGARHDAESRTRTRRASTLAQATAGLHDRRDAAPEPEAWAAILLAGVDRLSLHRDCKPAMGRRRSAATNDHDPRQKSW